MLCTSALRYNNYALRHISCCSLCNRLMQNPVATSIPRNENANGKMCSGDGNNGCSTSHSKTCSGTDSTAAANPARRMAWVGTVTELLMVSLLQCSCGETRAPAVGALSRWGAKPLPSLIQPHPLKAPAGELYISLLSSGRPPFHSKRLANPS